MTGRETNHGLAHTPWHANAMQGVAHVLKQFQGKDENGRGTDKSKRQERHGGSETRRAGRGDGGRAMDITGGAWARGAALQDMCRSLSLEADQER